MESYTDTEKRLMRPFSPAGMAILMWGTWLLVCGLSYANYVRLADWQQHGHLHVSVLGTVVYWAVALVVTPLIARRNQSTPQPWHVVVPAAMMLIVYHLLVSALF